MIELLKIFAYTGGEWVIYLLLLCSVLAVAVMVERAILLQKERKYFLEVKNFLGNTELTEKINATEQLQGFSARILECAVKSNSLNSKVAEENLNTVLFSERQRLEKRLIILGTLGNNAVYIGLFGTVLGVIKAFRDLAEQVGAGPEVVMQGLSEALIATAVGLMVAIPCVVAYNIFQKQIKDLAVESENMARSILAQKSSE